MTHTHQAKTSMRHRREPKGFWIHLSVFLLVNAGLVTLNLVRSPDKLWCRWVLLGWGSWNPVARIPGVLAQNTL